MKNIRIGSFDISENSPSFIIAELSANHAQNYDIAERTVVAMKEAGADAVKLQTYTADTITLNCRDDIFMIKSGTIWDSKNLYDLYKEAYTDWEWQPKLKKLAEELGMECFSSPFDFTAVDFLEEMDVPAYKIASFEITDIPLIEYAASKGKPMMVSTGIAKLEDIDLALETIRKTGNEQIILLKCTSSYPARVEDANLLTIPDMASRFGVHVGVSDHSEGSLVPVVSAALGAKVIEKHFILDRKLGGPDASFSLEPNEFKKMVEDVRKAEASLGKADYVLSPGAERSRVFGRSLFFTADIKKGDEITPQNLRSIRPSNGLHTKYYYELLGKKAAMDIKRGTPAAFELVTER